MNRVAIAWATVCISAAASFAACGLERAPGAGETQTPGANAPAIGAPTPGAGDVGLVSGQLTLFGGVQVTSLSWIIQGPNMYSGVVNIGDAQSVEFVAGGIQAADGYKLAMTGTDSAGDSCFGASAPFGVSAGLVTNVVLGVVCTSAADGAIIANVGGGSVAVDAGVSLVLAPGTVCPGIQSLSVNPAELAPGQNAQLGLGTTAPAAVTWSVSPAGGGTFLNPADGGAGANLNAPFFTCSTPNTQVTLTATVGLLDSGACSGQPFTTMSVLVNCEAACVTAADCPGADSACSPKTCVAGRCGRSTSPEGTACETPGNICDGVGDCIPFTFSVVRLGTGDAGTLTTTAAPVFIQQRLVSDGGIVGTPVLMPTSSPGAGQDLLTMPGNALIAGLARSEDGHFLSMVGYNAALGATNPANSSSTIVVGRIDSSGHVDTSTQFGPAGAAFLSLNSLRSAVTADGTSFWVAGLGGTVDGGSTGGIWHIPFGVVDGTQISTVPTRLLGIANGQLLASGETDAGEVFTVGTGLPASAPVTLTTLPGLPTVAATTASPWQFVFAQMNAASPGFDTLYVANDRAVGAASTGVQRFNLSGGIWTLTANLILAAPDGGAPVGFRGVAGVKTGAAQMTLIATTVEPTAATRIVVFTDDGTSSPWAGTSRVIAVANGQQEFFRGVSLSPHP